MIIRTILDTDLYKFTTSYAYIKLFPYAMGTFSFKDRDETEYSDEFVERLKTEISRLSHVALTGEELEYMVKNCRFLPRVYWEWLSSFRFQPEKIEVRLDGDRHLHIEISDYLYKAIQGPEGSLWATSTYVFLPESYMRVHLLMAFH